MLLPALGDSETVPARAPVRDVVIPETRQAAPERFQHGKPEFDSVAVGFMGDPSEWY